MANIKFSAFTNEAVDAATTQLVGYKVGDTSANYRYDVAQLKTALASDTIFTIFCLVMVFTPFASDRQVIHQTNH